MNTRHLLSGISVLALVLAGFVPGTAVAAPNAAASASVVAAACQVELPSAAMSAFARMTGTYLPGMSGGGAPSAAMSAFARMTGTYLPGMAGDSALSAGTSAFAHMTGTYLPGMAGIGCTAAGIS
jgi:hypothetical protein